MLDLRSARTVVLMLCVVAGTGCGGGRSDSGAGGGDPAPLPSAPDTFVGADTNADGVRDTAEAVLTSRYGASAPALALARAVSSSGTAALRADPGDPVASRQALLSNGREIRCRGSQLSPREQDEVSTDALLVTLDTSERLMHYARVRAAAGTFALDAEEDGPEC